MASQNGQWAGESQGSYKLPITDVSLARRNFPGYESYQFVSTNNMNELCMIGDEGNTAETDEGVKRKRGRETKR